MPTLSEEAEQVRSNNDKMIQFIYKEGQWESGIDLLLTYCIPSIEKFTH